MMGSWRYRRRVCPPDDECEQLSAEDETIALDEEAATCRERAVAFDEMWKPPVTDRKTILSRKNQSGDIIHSKSTLYLQK